MSKELKEVLFVFTSVHQTLQAEEELGKTEYKINVVPVPPYVNEGCGLGIKVGEKVREEVESYLITKGIEVLKIVTY